MSKLVSNKMKEKLPTGQIMTLKPSMLRMMQGLQTRAQRSCIRACIRACQLFCLPLDSLSLDGTTCCSAKAPQPKEDENKKERLWAPPSTVLIVNISNSTLTNCIIGDSNPSAVAEHQPLMQEYNLLKHAPVGCSCCRGQQGTAQATASPPACPPLPSGESQSVNIHSSRLNCVIIGDSNYMHAEQSLPSD